MSKLKTADGRVVSSKPKINFEMEDFYDRLYASRFPLSESVPCDSQAALVRHYTDELSDVSIDEIELARKQLKNVKAPVL